MQVHYKKYETQDFVCKKCNWKGKGSELSLGDFSDVHLIMDLECPNCFNLVAFWQAPLISEKKSKKNL